MGLSDQRDIFSPMPYQALTKSEYYIIIVQYSGNK